MGRDVRGGKKRQENGENIMTEPAARIATQLDCLATGNYPQHMNSTGAVIDNVSR